MDLRSDLEKNIGYISDGMNKLELGSEKRSRAAEDYAKLVKAIAELDKAENDANDKEQKRLNHNEYREQKRLDDNKYRSKELNLRKEELEIAKESSKKASRGTLIMVIAMVGTFLGNTVMENRGLLGQKLNGIWKIMKR